jgi:hypothetical protein
VSLRPRRTLIGLVLAGAALAALPASALAAGETLTVTPSNTQAGANPSITMTQKFAPGPGDTPKTVVDSLAPGMLSNLNANPSCLAGSPQYTPACEIGTSTADLNIAPAPSITPVPGTMYLVPGHSGDLAGIDNVTPNVTTYIGVSLNPSTPGGLNLTAVYPQSPGVQVLGFTGTLNPTLNGQPFTRLPSSCGTATTTMNVTYYGGGTGSASDSFTPTGCSSLPYAPTLATSITKDTTDSGATLDIAITQAANESASKSIVVNTPKALSPNVAAAGACLVGNPCQVGTATATSPLVPSAALATGTVTLGGTIAAPTLTIAFPALPGITLVGDIDLASGAVTFASVPDVPLTSLKLDITGPGGQKAFNITSCVPANVSGNFTAQSGATHTSTAAVAFTNCPVSPTVTRSAEGFAGGHPKLTFKVTRAAGAPNVAAVAIGVPAGLKFARSAFVSDKTCTTKGTKKCTTTTRISGLGVSGAKAATVALKHGRLVITLKKPASNVTTITVSGPLLTESKALQSKVKKHSAKSLKLTLKITDAKGTATTVFFNVKPH